ncbi:ECF transporter S component, partial [Streptomyces sp. NPDC006992]
MSRRTAAPDTGRDGRGGRDRRDDRSERGDRAGRDDRAVRAVRLGPRSVVALVLPSATGVAAFAWPLLADRASGLAHSR